MHGNTFSSDGSLSYWCGGHVPGLKEPARAANAQVQVTAETHTVIPGALHHVQQGPSCGSQ